MTSELPRPNDVDVVAAASRAETVLATLVAALGEGAHQLSLALDRIDGVFLTADVSLKLTPDALYLPEEGGEDEFVKLRMLLVYALEGSTARSAVLIATTLSDLVPRVRGWSARDGWLHPMDPAELERSQAPCADGPAPLRQFVPAPVLDRYAALLEDNPHG
ncbi:hypothetical protein [Streptomyces minutiscleroticus]|uniref:hypothetical protein n=1 Tax=Streptomyces minutiscleroticus TaxID=68238 RepID=UPI003333021B